MPHGVEEETLRFGCSSHFFALVQMLNWLDPASQELQTHFLWPWDQLSSKLSWLVKARVHTSTVCVCVSVCVCVCVCIAGWGVVRKERGVTPKPGFPTSFSVCSESAHRVELHRMKILDEAFVSFIYSQTLFFNYLNYKHYYCIE